jgi:hypothetical protein
MKVCGNIFKIGDSLFENSDRFGWNYILHETFHFENAWGIMYYQRSVLGKGCTYVKLI